MIALWQPRDAGIWLFRGTDRAQRGIWPQCFRPYGAQASPILRTNCRFPKACRRGPRSWCRRASVKSADCTTRSAIGSNAAHAQCPRGQATQCGEAFYKQAKSILRQLADIPAIIAASDEEEVGSVLIGLPASIASVIGDLRIGRITERLPRVSLEVSEFPAPIPPRLLTHLRRSKSRGNLWRLALSNLMTSQSPQLRRGFQSAVGFAGLPGRVTPHTLRHTASTWLMQRGVPIWRPQGSCACRPRSCRTPTGIIIQMICRVRLWRSGKKAGTFRC